MNPYEVLKTLIRLMEKYVPKSELLKEARNMVDADLSTVDGIERAQTLITEIQNLLHSHAPKNQYFGVKDGKIAYWPYERKDHDGTG